MLEAVPTPVKQTLERLQDTNPGCLQLKRNRGSYHVRDVDLVQEFLGQDPARVKQGLAALRAKKRGEAGLQWLPSCGMAS